MEIRCREFQVTSVKDDTKFCGMNLVILGNFTQHF